MAHHLQVFSQSSMRAFQRCHRYYELAYKHLYRPVTVAEPLEFGTKWHEIRELYWNRGMFRIELIQAIMKDQFDAARLSAMLVGYHARWGEMISSFRVLGVEQQFSLTRRGGRVDGKFDAIVEENGELWVVEEKTAKGDLEVDSPYWRRLEVDPQCSIYFDAAEGMYNRRPRGILYFVNVKPALKPFKKTENVRLKKDGTPCANQRLSDESPGEFYDRLVTAIAEQPERYYHLVRVPRLEHDIARSQVQVADVIADIRDAERNDRWTSNYDACIHPFGTTCAFLPVCAGRADIEDPMLYRQAKTPHEELNQ